MAYRQFRGHRGWGPARIARPRTDGGKVTPLVGAAGISAFPIAARVVQMQGLLYEKKNHMLMHAAGVITGGQIGSVVAAAIMSCVLKGMGVT